jgi:lysophospholipase L1-like esterase
LITLVSAAFTVVKPIKLFVLGDSISLQYGPYLEKDLTGAFVIQRKAGTYEALKNLDIPNGANGGDSRMVLNYLKLKLDDPKFHPDVLVLNCGLHDIKRDKASNKIAVDSIQYRQNLTTICTLLDQKKIPLIWVRTTNVVDSIHAKNPVINRYHKDLIQYNQIADEVMKNQHIPSIDLYSFTLNLGGNRFVDHVHYNAETQALQAAYIAGFLRYWEINQPNK